MSIAIRPGSIQEALQVEDGIPEFTHVHAATEYENRLGSRNHLILIAANEQQPVGFKVGYEREKGLFYSWLGGILPGYRRMGLAQQLMELQEFWAQSNNYDSIMVKSMNRFPGMLILLIKNGYQIVDLDRSTDAQNPKIVFVKKL